MSVFHVQLHERNRSARAFNLSEAKLERTIVRPWVRGEPFDLGDQEWHPQEGELEVYEGRELRPDEISMGRGWSAVQRTAEDVTERVIGRARSGSRAEAASPDPTTVAFKEAVLEQCGDGRIGVHQVLWLANSRYPQLRVSDRLALAEQAIWELLHEGRLELIGPGGPIARPGWEPVLLSWETWADPRAPSAHLRAI
jgi:hypothetical protein